MHRYVVDAHVPCLSQAIQRMLMFFCGRWPPKEVIESATREVHEVIGRHSNSISRLFNRVHPYLCRHLRCVHV